MERKMFPPKDVDEEFPVTFDFSDELTNGATITTWNVDVETSYGTDPNPEDFLSGVPQHVGPLILQKVHLGERGVTYHLRCIVDTSDGRTLTGAVDIPVRRF